MTSQQMLPLPLLPADVSLALQSLTSRMRKLQKGPPQMVCIYVAEFPHVIQSINFSSRHPICSINADITISLPGIAEGAPCKAVWQCFCSSAPSACDCGVQAAVPAEPGVLLQERGGRCPH